MSIAEKLKSRKFWAMIIGIGVGVATIFGLDEEIITTVAGAVVSVASVITYIVAEARVDAEAVALAVESVQVAVELLEDGDGDA